MPLQCSRQRKTSGGKCVGLLASTPGALPARLGSGEGGGAAARFAMEHLSVNAMNRSSAVHRGQHPHARNDFLQDSGPSTWANPIEMDRTHWDERFVDTLADGYNPIAHYEPGIGAGQDLDTRQKIGNMEQVLKQKEAQAAKAHPGLQQASVWMPKAVGQTRNPFNTRISSEGQRLARVAELHQKLGVDKVRLVEKSIIDTTSKAGHHTASLPSVKGGHTVLRGGVWPTTEAYYKNAGGH